ncbi:MAG: succinylglutamate desuccinylase/aspartoacylase family protein [Syntrophomonadaceae bacterium]|nr:succinylglutamate desuccinylase/aspartoacylase family protein [Syntrophomonadaceae bacterium]
MAMLVIWIFLSWPSLAAEAASETTKAVIASATPYATEVYIVKADKAGPTVMVVGGIHGNEPSGYLTAAKMKDYEIKKGTLIVIPEANKKAIKINKRAAPGDLDLNRCFPQSQSQKAGNELAAAIYNAARNNSVDWVIDLHEGYDYFSSQSSNSVGQSIIYQPDKETRKMAEAMLKNINGTIRDKNKKFTVLRYPVKGSLARSAADNLNAKAMIVETCTKSGMYTRNKYHQIAVDTLLNRLNMK